LPTPPRPTRSTPFPYTTLFRSAASVTNVPKVKPQHALDVTDRPGAAQSTLLVGLPAPNATSPDAISLMVTNALLGGSFGSRITRSEEHTSELQSLAYLVCRLLL